MKRKNLPKESLEIEFDKFWTLSNFFCYRYCLSKKKKGRFSPKGCTLSTGSGFPRRFRYYAVSRSPNALIGSDTPSLDPSHTTAVPSNENTTLKHRPLERLRSPKLHQPQVPDNTERLSRNSPPPLNDGENVVDQNPPAAIASECASEQMVLSTPPDDPNISEVIPLVQMESNDRDALPDSQGSQRSSKEKPFEQRRDGQSVSQKEGSRSKLSSSNVVFVIVTWSFEAYQTYVLADLLLPLFSLTDFASHTDCFHSHLHQPTSDFTQAGSHYSRLSTGTPKGAQNQQSISTGNPGANIPQQEMCQNSLNMSQPQVRDANIPPTHILQPSNISIPNFLSNFLESISRPVHLYTPDSQPEISQTSGVPGSVQTGGWFIPSIRGTT